MKTKMNNYDKSSNNTQNNYQLDDIKSLVSQMQINYQTQIDEIKKNSVEIENLKDRVKKLEDKQGEYSSDGKIKIEVKSASYIQAWRQTNLSTIRFSIRKTRRLFPDTNTYSDLKRHSDLYVFCLLKHKDRETINPLKLEQWEFYVVKTAVLDEKYKNQISISLNDLQKLTNSIPYHKLKSEIYSQKHREAEHINLN
ncbi:MAG: hypothetical protein LBG15_11990 [Dysgonamonadaceae bacterium]|jgi:polyhydroxyalkanoate synthesis regulator phasin|nr:hypothetical protein [Dysgonamonadaceae bacterium]